MAFSNRFFNWLWPSERRRAHRKESLALPLAAYYWNGADPKPRQVKNVSPEGMYLLTDERWYPNTMLQMTLVRSDRSQGEPGHSIRLAARVIRSGQDGVGFAFVLKSSAADRMGVFETDATKTDLKRFLVGLYRDLTGQTRPVGANSLLAGLLVLFLSEVSQ